jgi:putative thiamine transport system ATP-binding protein
MDPANNMLSIQNLCIYKNESRLFTLDTNVLAGEILTIMGPSGSGKSTLLSWLSGMLDPASQQKGNSC